MPEGPEIKKHIHRLTPFQNSVIKKAEVVSGRYLRKEIKDLNSLAGAKINSVSSKGKLIVFDLEKDDQQFSLLSTLGMSGRWAVANDHKHTRLTLDLGEKQISFVDPRNFGTFKVVSTAEKNKKLSQLGADIMDGTAEQFIQQVKKYGKQQPLAEALLDQRIACGCGNYIRAEAMYYSELAPQQKISDLSEADLRKLFMNLFTVAWCSYADIDPRLKDHTGFRTWIYWNSVSPKDHKIETYKDRNGRTVWYSPTEQTYGSR